MPIRWFLKLRPWGARLILACSVSLLVVLLSVEDVLHLGLFQRLELASIDYRFLYRGTRPGVHDSSDVVIVEINEESDRSLPMKYPFPREYYARLVRNLRRAGARAVGIDLIFDAADDRIGGSDSTLREALKETGFVSLAGKREQDTEEYERRPLHVELGNVFADVDSSVGLVNIRSDADGIFRIYSPYYIMTSADKGDVAVPTFAFAVLNRVYGYPKMTAPSDNQTAFQYNLLKIPKYDPGSFLINFYGPAGTFKHIRFHDVIDDSSFTTLDEEATNTSINTFDDPDFGYLYDGTFRDKIVLVGVTKPEYKDLFPVSIGRGRQRGDNQMYGVEIHANVIENVLRDEFLRVQSMGTEIPQAVFLVFLTFFVTTWFRSMARTKQTLVEASSFLFVVAEVLLVIFSALWCFGHTNLVLKVMSPLVAIVTGYIGSTGYDMVIERRQRMLIKTMFSTYVNASVVDELLADPGRLRLGGERKEMTVLFSDIEGFTSIAQEMAPERLVKLLNEYLDSMSSVIFEHHGTVDKYEGDAIMAFWGAPVPQEDHALRACRSALVMRDVLANLNTLWESEGRPRFEMRIGINTGEMIVGNMGSSGKFAYTVIGDSVNLASRLEGANKEYRTTVMVGKRTYDLVREEIAGRELDIITVKGRSEPVGVYELIAERKDIQDGGLILFLEDYEKAMGLYHARKWADAEKAFARLLQLRPSDYPTILHRERCARFATMQTEECSDIFALKEK